MMEPVLFHNGSALGEQIIETWGKKYSQFDELHVVDHGSIEVLQQRRPELVIFASDADCPFERVVLETCRELKLRVFSVLGRGSVVLLGPLETPEAPGCITCLQLRWENTFEHSLLYSIFHLQDGDGSDGEPLEVSSSDLSMIGDIVTDEIVSICLESSTHANGMVGVYNEGEPFEWVPLIPSHDCPRCNLMPLDDPTLAQLHFSTHTVNDLDALRVGSVDFESLQKSFVHTRVGYISASNALWNGDRYAQADAYIYEPSGSDIAGYGSGLSIVDAKKSAILEALERSCGVQAVNRRPIVFSKYADVSANAVHPSRFGLHRYDLLPSSHDFLEPFDEEKPYSWVWAHSTKLNSPILIPEQIAYYGRTADEKRFVTESSNGCAIGGTVEEAILHGIFEVLERDGFLNMWYAKMPVPELRLGRDCPPQTSDLFHYLSENGLDVRLFDISHDLNIPAICAVAIAEGDHYPKAVCGAACHLNPYQAVHGALRELTSHVLNLQRVSDGRREEAMAMFLDPTTIKDILDHAAVAALPESYSTWAFLLNRDDQGPTQSVEDVFANADGLYHVESRDIWQILHSVLHDLHDRGFDVLVLNQTSVEVSYGGLQALKVIIPGMTPIAWGHQLQRVRGLSRLYDLPYRLGYSDSVLTERDVNQDCHPFS